ncbi:MAG: histidinol-phosphate transaminase, partial [Paenisporosarcina sp.]
MKWKKQLSGMKAYQPGRSIDDVKKMYGLSSIVKLASNENPLGTSPKVPQFIEEQDIDFARYPDGYAGALRMKLAEHLQVNENQMLFGNGSDEIVLIIARALLQPGVNTVMATPTFPQYRHNAQIEGAEVREVPLIDGHHDLDGMLKQIDDQTTVVWLCSPNNPTGNLIQQAKLDQFISNVSPEVLIVLDEAYVEYITDKEYRNSITYLPKYKNVVILRTFSKVYGLASFRIGYAIGHEELIANLDPLREPFNTTSLSQGVAIAALSDQSFVEHSRAVNKQGIAQFESFCLKHNLFMYPTQANFVLIDIKTDSDKVFEE